MLNAKWALEDQHQRVNINTNIFNFYVIGKYETINDRIIFYRILGHIEIPNAHVWKMDTRCWI